jgi:hypothetical protein
LVVLSAVTGRLERHLKTKETKKAEKEFENR